VAWILLTNATVAALDDGVLTVEFAREGEAKGFASSGHDKLLGQVLQAMFGISPQIRAAARNPGSGPSGPRGGAGGGPGSGGGPTGGGGGGSSPAPGPAGSPGGATAASGPEVPQASADPRPGWADDPPPSWDDPSEGWDPEDDPADARPPADMPAGGGRPGRPGQPPQAARPAAVDLIERELGGRVIEDISDV
jgi:DNA polymerase-3 subunit gamma/tau